MTTDPTPTHPPDDLEAFMRAQATKDPAFASAYLNAQARTTARGLLRLMDTFGAVDWSKIPDGTDNFWLRRARIMDREANGDVG